MLQYATDLSAVLLTALAYTIKLIVTSIITQNTPCLTLGSVIIHLHIGVNIGARHTHTQRIELDTHTPAQRIADLSYFTSLLTDRYFDV